MVNMEINTHPVYPCALPDSVSCWASRRQRCAPGDHSGRDVSQPLDKFNVRIRFSDVGHRTGLLLRFAPFIEL
uniref:Uncharacterized protein n=1 Tax=Pristionchus pacificus TaxID=54126 RepID=A0A2A6CWE6_PRIPA|eukprot:PDM82515.1 hypothetical protein PRIPAC_36908 [Pristionchus pacificus]